MTPTRQALPALSLTCVFALPACHPGQPSSESSAPSAGSLPASAPTTKAGHFHAELALVGQPAVTTDGKDILVAVNVTNDGPTTFGSATTANNVNLGAHSIDASGKIADSDLARGHLPQIASGATQEATILLPATLTLGHRVELLPVQENIAWFDA
ncbi:MAG: hypothetical protein ACRESA_03215 [Gammaproteobacteria bacterium]